MSDLAKSRRKWGRKTSRIKSTMGVRYRALVEQVPAIIYTDSAEKIYQTLYINPQLKMITGYDPEEWISNDDLWYKMILPEDRERVIEEYERSFTAKQPSNSEYRIVTPDGRVIWVSDDTRLICDTKGKPLFWQGVMIEITARKQAEEEIRRAQQRMEMLVTSSTVMLYARNALSDFDATFISDNIYAITGYPKEEFLSIGFWANHIHPEDAPKVLENLPILFKQNYLKHEYRFMFKDGTYHWMYDELKLFKDDSGNPLEILGTWSDITERKQAEEMLAIQARIASIFSAVIDEAMFNEVLKVILDVMQSPFGVFGYLDENGDWIVPTMSRQIWDKCNDPEKVNRFLWETWEDSSWTRAMREKRTIYSNESSTNIPEGHVSIQKHISVPILFQGESIGLFMVANKEMDYIEADITKLEDIAKIVSPLLSARLQRERVEQALKGCEKRFRDIADNALEWIWEVDAQGKYTYASQMVDKVLGYTPQEILQKYFYDLFHPEDREALKAAALAAFASKQPFREFINRNVHKNGQTIWLSTSALPLLDDKGNLLGYRGSDTDITERKQVVEKLEEERILLRTLIDNLPDRIYVKDVQGHKIISNSADWLASGGKTMEDIIGKTDRDVYPPELAEDYWALDKAVMDSGISIINREEPGLDSQGNLVQILTSKVPLRDGNGKVVGLVGIGRDITERKQVELVREALYSISQAEVTGSIDDLYPIIHRALGNLMPVDNFYIALYDSKEDLLSFPYFVDQHDKSSPPHKPGHGLTEYVLRTGRPLLVDRQAFTQLIEQGEVDSDGVDSVEWMGVPLKAGDEVFGVIAVQSYTESVRFSHADMEMLEIICAQVTTVVERKLAHQHIADALELNDTLINASTLGISVYDSSGQCILANEAIARILGATRAQILGQNYNSIESWKKSGLLESAREAIASDKKTQLKIHTTSDSSKVIWLDCHFTPFVYNGEPHLLRTVEDISISKQAEIDLHAYATKLEQSNRDLQEFAYVASHDLQEPLRKVLAFSDLLVNEYRDAIDETGHDYLNRMQGASQRMQTLITDLLNFSRVETCAQPFTEVDLNMIAQEVVSDLENSIEGTQGRVEIGKLPTIEVDPTQIYQLLQNLIGNALKFRYEGCSPLVKVSAKINEDVCQISVEDNGIGFNVHYLDRIFKPFERLHSREEYEGSGMGLAICRRIVERHSGAITATSTPGEGSTFIVTLPIHQSKGDSSLG